MKYELFNSLYRRWDFKLKPFLVIKGRNTNENISFRKSISYEKLHY